MPLLVCDIAGTTIDDHGIVYQQLRACAEERGANVTPDQLNAVKGTEKRAALAALLYPQGRPANKEILDAAVEDFLTRLRRAYAQHPPCPFPGAEETLNRFRQNGVSIALTTGFQREIAEIVLGACGWGAHAATAPNAQPTALPGSFSVDALITSDSVAAGRPAPHLIHRAMEMTGTCSVNEVVAVGDTVADLEAAVNAGVRGVGVLSGGIARETLAAYSRDPIAIVESLAQLPADLFPPRRP